MVGDLRHSVRGLLRSPAFTLITLTSLALGIGANTAIFQLIDALSLRPLPVARPEELAFVRFQGPRWWKGGGRPHGDVSNPLFEKLRDGQQAFSSLGAFEPDSGYFLNKAGEARMVPGITASGDLFAALGIQPFIGRFITRDDDQPHCKGLVAVVSHRFWQHDLNGDPGAIGRKIDLDGRRFEVIGVTPPGFTGLDVGRAMEVAVPLCLDEVYEGAQSVLVRTWDRPLTVVGRLRPGWTLERASAHLAALSPGLMSATVPPAPFYTSEDAARYQALRLGAEPAATGISSLRDRYAAPLGFLLTIAGLVLLIACANLANLLLARATARQRELAVRLSLGSSRARLVRQLMVESLLLAVAGAALGLGLARVVGPVLLTFLPAFDEVVVDLGADWRVLGFTAGAATLTCLLFGLAPALRAARTDVGLVLKSTAASATDGRERSGVRRLLVGAQVAMSFALLVGALLFVRSLGNLAGQDPGFRTAGITRVGSFLDMVDTARGGWEPVRQQAVAAVRALPGVDDAALSGAEYLRGGGSSGTIWAEGAERTRLSSMMDTVGAGYFRTLGIPLLLGRDFGPGDTEGSPPVAVVNELFARQVFGAGSPIGRRFHREAGPRDPAPPVYEVVGVVANTKFSSLREPFAPIAFFDEAQQPRVEGILQMVVLSRLPPADLHAAVVRATLAAAPGATVWFSQFEEAARDSVVRERLVATFAAIFGALAAVLAAAGLYGVFAYSVARRRREIGIRMALGADGVRVGRMILGEAAWLLGGGLLVGVALALAGGRLAASLLFGLAPWDPLTFVMAAALLAAIAAVACLPAVRRAARVDPVVVLRD